MDSLMAGTSGTIKGYNMFAYCFNNPVNMTDSLGNWPEWMEKSKEWVDNNIITPTANFLWGVAEDIANYDSSNQSEEKVFESNYFSNYKGTIVIKTPFETSFSFGFIGLSIHQQDSDSLKHEYGHAIQMKEMGIVRYTTDVAIPSITINFLDRLEKLTYDYYSYPWEAEANKLGGTTLSEDDKLPLPQGEYSSYWDLIKLFFK